MFAAETRHAFSRCLVIREAANGAVMGYIVFWLTGDEVQLHDVAVAPGARGRGLGDALITRMLTDGAAAAATRAFLEVRVGNAPAIGLYRRAGFEVVGKRRAYYQDNDEDALVMAADIIPRPGAAHEAL